MEGETNLKIKLISSFLESIAQKEPRLLVECLAREPLKTKEREILLNSLVASGIPVESIKPLITELIRSNVLYKEEQERLLEYLLSKTLSDDQIQQCLKAAEKIIKDSGNDLTTKQQETLLESLLKRGISEDSSAMLIEKMLAAKQPGRKEDKKRLFDTLLKDGISAESVPLIIENLIAGQKLYKAERESLLQYIFSQPMSKEQFVACIMKLMEAVQEQKAKELLPMMEKVLEYNNSLMKLTAWADTNRDLWKEQQEKALYRIVTEQVSVAEVLLDMVCEGQYCYLKGACIEFIDRKQLWNMMEEILFTEEYSCVFDREDPYILDCGTNIGLAIYYYKHRYPNARVVGFEPWSEAYACAMRNVERNGWKDVVIHNVALDAEEGSGNLTIMEENSLAGTLTNRMDDVIERKQWKKRTECVNVKPLSAYFDQPVDFLKMDIEGVENRVIAEIKEKLPMVKWIYVEYHYGPALTGIL